MPSSIPLSDLIPAIEDVGFESASIDSVRTLLASAALLYYDYFLTLSDEVRLAWLRPRSLASVLFLLIRYLALLNMAVAMAIQIPDNTVSRYMLTDMGCQVLVEVAFAGHVIISAAVSAFVAARIMALWSRNWYLGVFLFLVGLINWSPYVQSVLVGYQSAAAPWPLQGCMAVTNDPNLDEDVTIYLPAAISAVNLTYEVLCLVLTVIKTVGLRRGLSDSGIQMHLTHLLLRDGSLYFVAMTILGVLNIASATPVGYSNFPMGNNLNEAFSRSLVPMLTVRFIANLKNAGLEQSTYITQVDAVSTLRFSPPSERVFASVAGPLHLVTDKKEENTA